MFCSDANGLCTFLLKLRSTAAVLAIIGCAIPLANNTNSFLRFRVLSFVVKLFLLHLLRCLSPPTNEPLIFWCCDTKTCEDSLTNEKCAWIGLWTTVEVRLGDILHTTSTTKTVSSHFAVSFFAKFRSFIDSKFFLSSLFSVYVWRVPRFWSHQMHAIDDMKKNGFRLSTVVFVFVI